jgi:RimJ/RimL family protein N-acetyltransferase
MGQTLERIKTDIQTQRLRLRTPIASDVSAIAALAGELDVSRMTARMPHPYLRIDAEGFISRAAQLASFDNQTLVVEHQTEGPIGSIGLFPSQKGQPEIGYWIGKPYWGQGFASEALRGLQDWAKAVQGRRYLTAGHFADNPISGQVLIKAGFLYTGEVRTLFSQARGATVPSRMMMWLA